MKTNTLAPILAPLWICLALLCCAAKSPVSPPVVALGGNTFEITRQAPSAFSRDIDKLKAEAQEDATKYCAEQGKVLKIVSLTGEKHFFGTGYYTAKIVFKALNPGETDTSAEPSVTAAPAAEKLLNTDELVAALTKLDDLRKKGILTDEEFQAEKKKVLNRSR